MFGATRLLPPQPRPGLLDAQPPGVHPSLEPVSLLLSPRPGLFREAAWKVSVRLFARTMLGICVLGLVSVPALGVEPQHLEGIWHGELSGAEVLWHFEAASKGRLDGRRATWNVSGDSLLVEFEPLGDSNPSEKAVYRFVASDTHATYRRLFIYGFDLGQSGLLLTREISEDDMARLQAAVKAGSPAAAPVAAPIGARAAPARQ